MKIFKKTLPVLIFISIFSVFFFPSLLYAQSTPWSFYNNPLQSNAMDIFYNGSGAANPALRILTNGYLGIGVTPTRPLQVHSTTADNQVYLSSAAPSLRFGNSPVLSASTLNAIIGMGTMAGHYLGGAGDLNTYTTGNSHLIFGTANLERMRIDGSGNIGIGTASPQYRLTVDVGGGDQLQFYKPSEDRIVLQTTLNSQPNNGYGGDASNRLLLQPVTGYIGMGTLNPNRKLDISNDGGNDGITLGREPGQDNMQIIQTYIDNQWANRASYAGGCCNPLVLQPDVGNVVIGTPAGPTSKLHVQGTAKITGALGTNGWDPFGCGTQIEGTSYHNCLAGHTYIQSDLRVGRWLGLNGYAALGCGSYGLCVGGAAWSNAAFYDGSDIRTKKNIRPVKDALNKVLALEGVLFEFKAEDYPGKNYPTDTQIGFIAQQVESILPEVVETGSDEAGLKSIAYAHVTAVLVEAIKEQNQQVQNLQRELQKQQETNVTQNEELIALKKELSKLNEAVQKLKYQSNGI